MRKENGILYFKENWFFKYVWSFNSFNILGRLMGDKNIWKFYPKNICSVLWGLLIGIIITPLISLVSFAIFFVLWLLMFALIIIGGFCGYYLFVRGEMFGRYKHWGKKQKYIPVAPWEVCAVILAVYLAVNYGPQIYFLAVNSIALSVLLAIASIIIILLWLFKTTLGTVTRECIKAFKQKHCPLVVIESPKK